MSHAVDSFVDEGMSKLVIANHKAANATATRFEDAAVTELRITPLSFRAHPRGHRGIRLKVRDVASDRQIGVVIQGEDLYALREFLAELPEEAFVRPADPVEKQFIWTVGDIVSGGDEIHLKDRAYYQRKADDRWHMFRLEGQVRADDHLFVYEDDRVTNFVKAGWLVIRTQAVES